MDARRILLIQGHPDPAGGHFGHLLAEAYRDGAAAAGHELRQVDVATLDFPLLRSQRDWEHGALPPTLQEAQDGIGWAQHILLFFPLWMGDMPALLKGFLEQVLRPGFAADATEPGPTGKKMLAGRSARVVVTMAMPAAAYRYWFRAHSVKSLERNLLGMCGIGPIHETLVGSIQEPDEASHAAWLEKLRGLGAEAA